jgi:hypothetical protein
METRTAFQFKYFKKEAQTLKQTVYCVNLSQAIDSRALVRAQGQRGSHRFPNNPYSGFALGLLSQLLSLDFRFGCVCVHTFTKSWHRPRARNPKLTRRGRPSGASTRRSADSEPADANMRMNACQYALNEE